MITSACAYAWEYGIPGAGIFCAQNWLHTACWLGLSSALFWDTCPDLDVCCRFLVCDALGNRNAGKAVNLEWNVVPLLFKIGRIIGNNGCSYVWVSWNKTINQLFFGKCSRIWAGAVFSSIFHSICWGWRCTMVNYRVFSPCCGRASPKLQYVMANLKFFWLFNA